MFDYEKLIIEVESKPCLWNIGDSDYHNKHFKALAWTSVCETLYSDWNELSATEKDERVKDIKDKKWRHLRDNYLKYIKQENSIKSGASASNRKKYHFAEILSFLKPVTERRSTFGNFEDDLDETVECCNTSAQIIVDSDDQIIEVGNAVNKRDAVSMEQTVNFQSKKSKKNQKEPTTTPFQNKLLSYIELTQNNDPDKHFLLSLLPDYKKLNDSQKLEFRLNSLQFFKNVQLSASSSSVYSQPYSNQNNAVYPQHSSTLHLPNQNLLQNSQWYPSIIHSTQDLYPSPPQALYPHHQSDSLPPSS